jgi:hypothetical protein
MKLSCVRSFVTRRELAVRVMRNAVAPKGGESGSLDALDVPALVRFCVTIARLHRRGVCTCAECHHNTDEERMTFAAQMAEGHPVQ